MPGQATGVDARSRISVVPDRSPAQRYGPQGPQLAVNDCSLEPVEAVAP
jgi:hypothetical protein